MAVSAMILSRQLRELPFLLKVSCALVALQAVALVALAAIGLTLDNRDSFYGFDAALGAIGGALLGTAVRVAHRSRLARWCCVVLEALILSVGLVPEPWVTKLDLFGVSAATTTLVFPGVILYGLVVDRRVRRFFRDPKAVANP
jgi:hypothetical protein